MDYSGVGVWYDVADALGTTAQQKIDGSINKFFADHPFSQVTNQYILKNDAGGIVSQATFTATVVPEPAAAGVVVCGLGILALRRRRVTSV